ncbi:MAG: XdhC family protein [Woeseiaceae bacterium]|nr:XdhC family protein [Woeseiaceae bacterium]
MIERLPYHLSQFFRKHSSAGRPLALITVLSTEGSTYSKAGSQMLVNESGDFQGMLSGGCLEGDLAERSKTIMANGRAEVVSYDLRGDDDVFGLGVGCEGALRILIQPLIAAKAYEPFKSFVDTLEDAPHADLMLADADAEIGVVRLLAPLRLLILGAGQDTDPLLLFAATLGWRVWVSDHRPAAVAKLATHSMAAVACVPVDEIESHFDLTRFDAVIVKSHNLDADRTYLRILASSPAEFIGLLGPPHRRERLLREIGADADKLGARLRGPVGQQIGGRGPAAIALEIVAELQAEFATKN